MIVVRAKAIIIAASAVACVDVRAGTRAVTSACGAGSTGAVDRRSCANPSAVAVIGIATWIAIVTARTGGGVNYRAGGCAIAATHRATGRAVIRAADRRPRATPRTAAVVAVRARIAIVARGRRCGIPRRAGVRPVARLL